MRLLASLALLSLSACTCGSEPTAPVPEPITPSMEPMGTSPPAPSPPAPSPPAPSPPPTPTGSAPERAERPATARERAARVQDLPDAERTRLRERARHLREGRRLAHDGDHVGALAAFQSGLVLEPTDATLLCEAGLQAHRTGDLVLAQTLLERGAAHSARPSTEGACLYNLGRVLEDRGDPFGAAEVYTRSVEVRPNQVVQARLAALDAELDEEVTAWEEEEVYGVDLSVLEAGATFADVGALCTAVGTSDCWSETRYESPTPSPTLRALQIVTVHSDTDLTDFGYLVAHTDRGVVVITQLLTCDSTDTYGRQEAFETVTGVTFDGSSFEVQVEGHLDEADGEAELYYRCEEEGADDEATMACFEAGSAELSPPERWASTVRYRVDANGFEAE